MASAVLYTESAWLFSGPKTRVFAIIHCDFGFVGEGGTRLTKSIGMADMMDECVRRIAFNLIAIKYKIDCAAVEKM